MMYFPAAILTGRIDLAAAAARLRRPGCVGAGCSIVARFIWLNGLRKHTAVGG